jgi:ubiquinone biosynthesis protein
MRVISKNKVKLLPDVFLLMKSIIIIEGLGKELDPNFNVITHSRKFAVDLQKQRYSARRLLRYIKKGGRDFSYFAHRLPQDIIEIVNNLKQGQLKIAFEHRNLDKFIHTLDKISNRISLSLLISALVISSSVIIHTDKGPFVFGIPLLALAGLLIAAVLGLVLLISVLRSQK